MSYFQFFRKIEALFKLYMVTCLGTVENKLDIVFLDNSQACIYGQVDHLLAKPPISVLLCLIHY